MAINNDTNKSLRSSKYESMNIRTIVRITDKDYGKAVVVYDFSDGATFKEHRNPYHNFD